ncbi:MAG TPA: di-heme oxidoredictase family protein, partial [Haliscomenobacter sp.]|nr:di-heme oxidoredictase family protein [Haliscomenobacter sp.]
MGKNFIYLLFTLFCCAILFSTCEKILPPTPAENELLDGPIPGLTGAENARFLKGDIAFNDEIFTPQTGLGPLFVATSCGSCHAGDGKGTPFTTLT